MAMAEMRRRMACKLAPSDWRIPDTSARVLELQQRALASNIVLEVRDARLPLTSASREIYEKILSWKNHLIVVNKSDLADPCMLNKWKLHFHRGSQNYIFVNARDKDSVKQMVRKIKSLILKAMKAERSTLVLLAGLPNVGKSLLTNTLHRVGRYNISALEKLTLADVGRQPYLTRHMRGYKMNYHPPMYILDTPSVMHSSIDDPVDGMNLALAGAMEDEIVGVKQLACYLLAIWNSGFSHLHEELEKMVDAHRAKEFITRPFDTHSPTDMRLIRRASRRVEVKGILASSLLNFEGDLENEDAMDILVEGQLKELQEFFQSKFIKKVTITMTASMLLRLYRSGSLGLFTLDRLPEKEAVLAEVSVDEPEIELPPEVEQPKKKPYRRKRSLQNATPAQLAKIERRTKRRIMKKTKPRSRRTFVY